MKTNLHVKVLSHTKLLIKGKFHSQNQLIQAQKKIIIRFTIRDNDISENAEKKNKKSIV